jgi:hypothetical protein
LKARMLAAAEAAKDDDTQTDDGSVCFICANPVAHQSIAPCNHSTCHICGLRMRALYKTKDCAHCRVRAQRSLPDVVHANAKYIDSRPIRDLHG